MARRADPQLVSTYVRLMNARPHHDSALSRGHDPALTYTPATMLTTALHHYAGLN